MCTQFLQFLQFYAFVVGRKFFKQQCPWALRIPLKRAHEELPARNDAGFL